MTVTMEPKKITQEQLETLLEISGFDRAVQSELSLLRQHNVKEEYVEEVRKLFYSDEFKKQTLEVYAQYLNFDELNEIIEFHQRPTIKRWNEKYPEIMKKSQESFAALMNKIEITPFDEPVDSQPNTDSQSEDKFESDSFDVNTGEKK